MLKIRAIFVMTALAAVVFSLLPTAAICPNLKNLYASLSDDQVAASKPLVRLNMVEIFGLFFTLIALSASLRSFAAEQASDVPPWLRAHVGDGEGQIAQVILRRARNFSK